MNIFDLIQITGGILLVIAFMPQILKMIRTKSVGDMSLTTFILNFIAVGFMEVYAWHLLKTTGQMAFLITNTLGWMVAATLLILVLRFRKHGTSR